jgi:hypothetical protein
MDGDPDDGDPDDGYGWPQRGASTEENGGFALALRDSLTELDYKRQAEHGFALFHGVSESGVELLDFISTGKPDQVGFATAYRRTLDRDAAYFFVTRGTWMASLDLCADSRQLCGLVGDLDILSRGATEILGSGATYPIRIDERVPQFMHTDGHDTSGSVGVPAHSRQVSYAYATPWTDLPTAAAPPPLQRAQGFWTGKKFLVFGLIQSEQRFAGGLFDPVTKKWESLPDHDMPAASKSFAAAWNGKRLFVYAGKSGAVFDPEVPAWTPLAAQDAPDFVTEANTADIVAAASERFYYVYGLKNLSAGPSVKAGAVYDLATGTWSTLETSDAPGGDLALAKAFAAAEQDKFIVWSPVDAASRMLYDKDRQEWRSIDLESGDLDSKVEAVLFKDTLYAFSGAKDYSSLLEDKILAARLRLANETWKSANLGSFRFDPDAPPMAVDTGLFAWTAAQSTFWYADTFVGEGFLYLPDLKDADGKGDPRTIWFPETDSTPVRRRQQLALYGGDMIFLWGGCKPGDGDTSCEYVNTGSYVTVVNPKPAPE